MAVAPELMEAAGATEGASSSAEAGSGRAAAPPVVVRQQRSSAGDWASTGRGAFQRVSTPGAAAQTVTKLIWAVAVGLIVLEIAAEATGQQWSFALPGVGRGKPSKPAYLPLYTGQVTDAMPGVLPTGTVDPAIGQSVIASNLGLAASQRRQPSLSGPGPLAG